MRRSLSVSLATKWNGACCFSLDGGFDRVVVFVVWKMEMWDGGDDAAGRKQQQQQQQQHSKTVWRLWANGRVHGTKRKWSVRGGSFSRMERPLSLSCLGRESLSWWNLW